MKRSDIFKYVQETYNTEPEYPWSSTPSYAVMRHAGNRKWYCVVMNLPRATLGLTGPGNVEAMNVKCEPEMTYMLRLLPGFLPAYHMNKEHWITILLDGSVSKEDICDRIDASFKLTK